MVLSPMEQRAATAHDNGVSEGLDFRLFGEPQSPSQLWMWDGLQRVLERHGHTHRPGENSNVQLIVNFTDLEHPQKFWRRAQSTFVVTLVETDDEPADIFRAGYPILVRALSNLGIYVVRKPDGIDAHFLTMEQGHYVLTWRTDEDPTAFFDELYERLAPLATSQLVINNVYHRDLPEALWSGDEITQQLIWAGEQLADLRLLPAPWPIHEYLNERDLRHVKLLYGIGGLSYGNLSARKDADTFWMSASGVDKSALQQIGRDILLVTGYLPGENAMELQVPPEVEPRRVSVDAIEHWMIYQEHPQVGAIIHVHAWMDGIESTHINFPCGTRELALAVSDLIRKADDPSRAVVGLKNHGLTITGHSLVDIFERMRGRIIPQVPMT